MKAMRRMSRKSPRVAWRSVLTTLVRHRHASLPSSRPRLRGAPGEDGVGHVGGPPDGPDVMDPEDVGSPGDAQDPGGDRALEPVVGREAEGLSDEGLARYADQDGAIQGLEEAEAVDQGEIVFGRLAEPDPRDRR